MPGYNVKKRRVQRRHRKMRAQRKAETSLIPRKYQNAMWKIATKAAMAGASYLICNKYIDQDLGTVYGSFNTTGAFSYVNQISQGSTTNTRDGKAIHMKNLYIKYVASIVNNTGKNICRIMVLKQKGNVDTSSIANFTADVVDASGGWAGSTYNGPIDHNKFEILYDKVITLAYSSSSSIQHYEVSIPLNNMKVEYAENTSTPANDGIFVFLTGDAVAGANAPTIQGFLRLLYSDG